GWPAGNIGQAVLQGASFTAAHRWAHTGVRASLDLQDPHDRQTGEVLPFRARKIFRLAADHRVGRGQLGAEWYVADARYGSGTRERMAGYGVLDLTVSYDITDETQ